MTEIHDFDDTVVAIFTDRSVVEDVVSDLSDAGYDADVLEGEDGRRHLDPAGETGGVGTTVKRLLTVFGDQFRIAERLAAELEKGAVVVSVDATPDEANEAVQVLQRHGGEFIWKLGSWTYTQVED